MNKRFLRIVVSAFTAGLGVITIPAVVLAQDAVFVTPAGNVGIGTSSPARTVDISRPGVVDIGLQNTSGTAVRWFIQTDNDANKTFKISREGGGGPVITVNARQDVNGVTFKVDGSVQATNVVFSSSRELKHEFAALEPREVLAKVAALPISEWSFKEGPQDVRHIGPTAEDFHSAFDLGPNTGTISLTDTSGVALAAIQGLHEAVAERDEEIAELRQQLDELRQKVERLANPE